MQSGMNWNRVRYEKKIRDQGYAPVEDPRPSSKPKIVKVKKPKASSAISKKSHKPKRRRSLSERREATRRNYIAAVKKALASGQTAPAPFKKLDPKIKEQISALGPELWVQQQPEFKKKTAADPVQADLPSAEKMKKFAQIKSEIEDIEVKIVRLQKQYSLLKHKLEKKKSELKSLG